MGKKAMNTETTRILYAIVAVLSATTARADVIEFTDKDEWFAAVGVVTTIDFTGFPDVTVVTDQYADLGVHFTDGNDLILSAAGFLNDGWGVDGNGDINVSFDAPVYYVAVDFPGGIIFDLLSQGELIFTSSSFGIDEVGNFAGLLSSEPFDAIRLFRSFGSPSFIDDFFFGPQPCPFELDSDGVVGITDFLLLLAAWGTDPGGPPDFDGDGNVGITDFLALLVHWGPCSFFVDCNGNGVFDLLDLLNDTSPDCNGNGVPDECDITDGASPDCNANGVPDECDTDCNDNGVPDDCDIASGTSLDCNANGIPDECDPDCNANGVPDECDIAAGTSLDSDGDGLPDECEIPLNDSCLNAIPIADGVTPFVTFGATAEGPLALCGDFNTLVNDVWFLYTAPCTGIATFSLCNAVDFDSRLVLQFASVGCPPSLNPLACSDNAAGCGQTSEIQLLVAAGIDYLLRVGGADGGGEGFLTITCEP